MPRHAPDVPDDGPACRQPIEGEGVRSSTSDMRRRRSLQIPDGQRPCRGVSDRCQIRAMSQDDINNGPLVCVIEIAPVEPAEFMIFRIRQV